MATQSTGLPGYLNPKYARSFEQFGEPTYLPGAQGWLIKRPIPGSAPAYDAMGCYPLFCCQNWSRLGHDINALQTDLVSLVLITDPMSTPERHELQACFNDVRAYKRHYVVETRLSPVEYVNKSHRLHALKALRTVKVEVCDTPLQYLGDWIRLYAILADRHSISGLRRFSAEALESQLTIPGMVMFRASVNNRTVGLDLWYIQGNVAQGHLTAFDDTGYKHRASYASKWTLLEYFRNRVRWINLGAGISADESDGLSYFKQGFSTGIKQSWLCERIFQPKKYERLTDAKGFSLPHTPHYFPAYRAGELI